MPNSRSLIDIIQFQLSWAKRHIEKHAANVQLDIVIGATAVVTLREIALAAGIEFNEDDFDQYKLKEKLANNA